MEIEDEEVYREIKSSSRKTMKLGEFKDLYFNKIDSDENLFYSQNQISKLNFLRHILTVLENNKKY